MPSDATFVPLAEVALDPRAPLPATQRQVPGERATRGLMLDTRDGLVSVTARAWRIVWTRS